MGVIPVAEEGIDVMADAKRIPSIPMVVECLGAFSSDAKSDSFLNNAHVRAESVGCCRWQSVQGSVCG